MSNETGLQTLRSLIPLGDFKAILGVDDREDCLDFTSVQNPGYEFSHSKNPANSFQPPSLAAFCLITSTYAIEEYCKRRLFLKKHFERIEISGDLSAPLCGAVRFTSSLTRRNEKLLLPLREYPV
ncbi:MAG: hypothetical protein LBQ88_15940, partial [Treponema sp.]|nr:hypothetical protein [Treponema sp.]